MTEPVKIADASGGSSAIHSERLMEHLARASLAAQGIAVADGRVPEIAAEARRLLTGLSTHTDRLSYYDEPSHFAALLLSESADE